MSVRVLEGDCRARMAELEAASVQACITDPPYGIAFMGKGWDSFGGRMMSDTVRAAQMASGAEWTKKPYAATGKPAAPSRGEMAAFQAWCVEWAIEVLRVLVPGSYLLAFGGTRTYHRLACAIEDAGFEIVDSLCWLYGSGFPKHRSKLKPAHEPIVMARKPAAKATPLNIDACRVSGDGLHEVTQGGNRQQAFGMGRNSYLVPTGRWPANVVLDEVSAEMLDEQSGERAAGARPASIGSMGYHGGASGVEYGTRIEFDTGGASRFFYTSKASKAERWDYLSCDCEAARLRAWENEDRSQRAPMVCMSPARDTFAATSTDESSSHTLPLGSEFTGESREDSKSTTLTKTSKTTDSPTSDSSARQNTSESTAAANYEATDGGSLVASAASSSQSTPNTGISHAKAGRSTGVAVPATSRRSSARNNCAECGNPLKVTAHPTVKPVDLMRWLVRLVTPENGLVLDPFAGSGTTGVAAVLEDRRFLGIEKEPEYVAIAERRISRAAEQGSLFRDSDVA